MTANWRRLLVGAYLEVRVIPVMLWSFSGVCVGAGLAAGAVDVSSSWLVVAAVIGVLLQGIVAHCVNEITDWRSGTDADPAPRLLSGGSKVVAAGLLRERELAWLGGTAAVLATAIGFAVAAARGWWLLVFGAVGLVGAIVYTLPPIRAAYAPFAGEAVAFACVWACVAGSYALQAGTLSGEAALVGIAHAAFCVSMLMLHHYLDRGPDARAVPPKITSVVRLGSTARAYGTAWAALSLAAGAVAVMIDIRTLPMAGAAIVGLCAQRGVDPERAASVTTWESLVIAAGICGALATTIVHAPELAWVLAVPLTLVPVEFAVARKHLVP